MAIKQERSSKIAAIILAAGKGTRVQKYTLGEPKALLKVAGVPALVHIVRELMLRGLHKFVVVVNPGEKERIRRVWDSAFSNLALDLRIAIQPMQLGPADALLYGLQATNLDTGVLVCLNDTLFNEDLPFEFDWVGVAQAKGVGRWCWAEHHNGKLVKLYDKITPPSHVSHVLVGLYYFRDPLYLAECIGRAKLQTHSVEGEFQLSEILNEYNAEYPVQILGINTWIDCGSEENYLQAQKLLVKHRYFNNIEIIHAENAGDKYIIKSGEKEKITDEINWFRRISEKNPELIPRVVQISEQAYSMNIIDKPTLASNYLYEPLGPLQFLSIVQALCEQLSALLWKQSAELSDLHLECKLMYEIKPMIRLSEWPRWREIIYAGALAVNGQEISGVQDVIRAALEPSTSASHRPLAGAIHGDLHFGNVFYDQAKRTLTLIDPRGRFGDLKGIWGDVYYDAAKLRHSYHGMYDAILDGLYELKEDEKSVFRFQIGPERTRHIEAIDAYLSSLGFNLDSVRSIELGILLSLIPLHRESPKRQMAIFLQALLCAREIINE